MCERIKERAAQKVVVIFIVRLILLERKVVDIFFARERMLNSYFYKIDGCENVTLHEWKYTLYRGFRMSDEKI